MFVQYIENTVKFIALRFKAKHDKIECIPNKKARNQIKLFPYTHKRDFSWKFPFPFNFSGAKSSHFCAKAIPLSWRRDIMDP